MLMVSAPGKIILSGEHAVVYHAPALAMAINRSLTVKVSKSATNKIAFELVDIAHRSSITQAAMHALKDRARHYYQRFHHGEVNIRDVLQNPHELAQVVLALLVENYAELSSIKLHLQSEIPVGCGMGSSAALIISLMYACQQFFQLPITQEKLFALALAAENLQHGRSSGLDLQLAIHGGCFLKQEKNLHARLLPKLTFFLVNTGKPASTTGECIEKVKPYFRTQQLLNEFADITLAMDTALKENAMINIQTIVRANQRLLERIGVVPTSVQKFIQAIEKLGGAAKICGAGTVSGEQAGVVWVLLEDMQALQALVQHYHYEIMTISMAERGVHVV